MINKIGHVITKFLLVSFAWFFNLFRTIGSLQPVQILPETPQTLLKYKRMSGQVKMFLACMSNNFSWPPQCRIVF
ncbi:unnamed protein product [Rhizophagus irregularis]|nr:unnamed protein product [Rhizophagus irregularis]CAB5344870.1 unnamed protein product [Rhizophagus irregularis]